MQGFVFCEFQEYVQKSYGFDVWDTISDQMEMQKKSYSLFKKYSTEEFEKLISTTSLTVNKPYQEILEDFGFFSAPKLWRICSRMIPSKWNFADFLENLATFSNTLMENAITGVQAKATLKSKREGDSKVTIFYHSPRKLCFFGKGVIRALAKQYKSRVDIVEHKCLLKGDEECEIICYIHALSPAELEEQKV